MNLILVLGALLFAVQGFGMGSQLFDSESDEPTRGFSAAEMKQILEVEAVENVTKCEFDSLEMEGDMLVAKIISGETERSYRFPSFVNSEEAEEAGVYDRGTEVSVSTVKRIAPPACNTEECKPVYTVVSMHLVYEKASKKIVSLKYEASNFDDQAQPAGELKLSCMAEGADDRIFYL